MDKVELMNNQNDPQPMLAATDYSSSGSKASEQTTKPIQCDSDYRGCDWRSVSHRGIVRRAISDRRPRRLVSAWIYYNLGVRMDANRAARRNTVLHLVVFLASFWVATLFKRS